MQAPSLDFEWRRKRPFRCCFYTQRGCRSSSRGRRTNKERYYTSSGILQHARLRTQHDIKPGKDPKDAQNLSLRYIIEKLAAAFAILARTIAKSTSEFRTNIVLLARPDGHATRALSSSWDVTFFYMVVFSLGFMRRQMNSKKKTIIPPKEETTRDFQIDITELTKHLSDILGLGVQDGVTEFVELIFAYLTTSCTLLYEDVFLLRKKHDDVLTMSSLRSLERIQLDNIKEYMQVQKESDQG